MRLNDIVTSTERLQSLLDPEIQGAREEACRRSAEALDYSGRVLWAYGLASEPTRRALALVSQMGGALARGTIVLLNSKNGYGAAALLRQIVEVEYLLYLFAHDPDEGKKWLRSSPDELRKQFAPARMRRRSNGRFQDDQYWAHCEIGGHPHPVGAFLLPEHDLREPLESRPLNVLWRDLAQHLERAVGFLGAATHVINDVPAVTSSLARARAALLAWRTLEPDAGDL